MEKEGLIRWFSELSNEDIPVAGGKGASLAEMYNTKLPVPPGFVVTAQAYSYFLEKAGIYDEMNNIISKFDVNNTKELNLASRKIRKIIEEAEFPKELEEEILESYEMLDVGSDGKDEDALSVLDSSRDIFVAVRSSATTEDLADASFAGQQETFLNVMGKEDLLKKVKKCISSLFTARAIYYREKKGFEHGNAKVAVVVQKMISSKKSGVMFSKNPVRDDNSIVVEAVWGLGEGIVSGKIKPDHYVISEDLESFGVLETNVAKKKIAIVKNEEGKNEEIKLSEEKSNSRVLDNYELKRLAQYAKQLEEHYNKPQDIEFAIDDSGIFIVQSRPITTKFQKAEGEFSGEEILSGLGASPGISSGVVKIVEKLDELEKVDEGDVLVTEMTNPDMVVTMQKAAAIITDEGGVTSHAAIVSREMGIPAVVGTGDATKKLRDGVEITVDGSSGKVFKGKSEKKLVEVLPVVPTKTEIKVILDIPAATERAAKTKVRGVGLLRLEGIIASGKKHPLQFVKEGKMGDYVDLISKGIKEISEPFEEIWVRTSDLRTDEFKNLEGAPEVEGNPMLGDHGIRFGLKNKEIMKAELVAIKEIADELPQKKFGVMIPQVISVEEVKKTKEFGKEIGLPENIKIGIMIETPASVQIINDLCEEGIGFISFGTNDLTQYTLAVDRNNENVQDIYDEMNPAIRNSIKYVLRRCKKHGVKTSICGQAGSREEVVKFLLEEGIDSISVNADVARKISEFVAGIEKPGRAGEVLENDKRKDVEEDVLEALDEYNPGERRNEEVPPLNDAIPVESEDFNRKNI